MSWLPSTCRDANLYVVFHEGRSAAAATGVSHVDRYRVEVDVAEIRDLFDGREQTIAIGARPMFVRKVY